MEIHEYLADEEMSFPCPKCQRLVTNTIGDLMGVAEVECPCGAVISLLAEDRK